MQTDEDKMIKKLEEHRDTIKLVAKIGELHGITVTPTINNNPKGDFYCSSNNVTDLIAALDKYLLKYKYTG